MACVICKTGQMNDGLTTVTLERRNSLVIVKGIPAAHRPILVLNPLCRIGK